MSMSQLQLHVVHKLSEDEIKAVREDYPNKKLRNISIVISEENPINIYRDLILFSNANLRETFQRINSKKNYLTVNDTCFDEQSKEFLIGLSLFIESLYNSDGLRNNNDEHNFVGIQEFDKLELKNKLQRVVNLL